MNLNIQPTGEALDTFLSTTRATERLIEDYKQYRVIIVALDMDSTIIPKPGESCDQVIELMQIVSHMEQFKVIVFTCRESKEQLTEVRNVLANLNIKYEKINENIDELTIHTSNKIFYNIFLDDRAGLKSAYESLVGFLAWLEEDEGGE